MHGTSFSGRLILVCEDEPLIAIDIADAFTKAGARVVIAPSQQDALVAVEEGSLAAAILDHASAKDPVRDLQRIWQT
jgi:DNA-binding response OmpR family regulator